MSPFLLVMTHMVNMGAGFPISGWNWWTHQTWINCGIRRLMAKSTRFTRGRVFMRKVRVRNKKIRRRL